MTIWTAVIGRWPVPRWRWWIARLLRVVVAGVLGFAGVLKALDPTEAEAVLRFNGLAELLIPPAMYSLVAVELGMVWWLALGVGRLGVVVAAGLFVLFTGQLTYLYFAENAPTCGCLGLLERYLSARDGHLTGMIRNGVLILFLGVVAVLESRK